MPLCTRLLLISTLGSMFLFGCSSGSEDFGMLPMLTYTQATKVSVPIITEHSGKATALLVAEVRPQVGGIIQKQLFEEGSQVKAGQTLYQIDPALYQATLDTAKANLARAEANAFAAKLLAQRYAELVQSKAVSRQEYDNAAAGANQAKAEVSAAKASLDTAQINLAYTKVTSPIDGIVGKSYVTPGALVSPAQPTALATVQNRDFMYVDIPRSGTDLLRMLQAEQSNAVTRSTVSGAKATLILADGTEYTEKGELMFADVSVDPSTGSYITRAKFPNPQGIIMHNMFVRVRLEEGVTQNAILLPQRMVSSNVHGNMFVHVLKEFKETVEKKAPPVPDPSLGVYEIEVRPIKVSRAIDNMWIVTDGLGAEDKIVVDGASQLRPGQNMVMGKKVDLNAKQEEQPASNAPEPQGK